MQKHQNAQESTYPPQKYMYKMKLIYSKDISSLISIIHPERSAVL
jgi:hypothetical protein